MKLVLSSLIINFKNMVPKWASKQKSFLCTEARFCLVVLHVMKVHILMLKSSLKNQVRSNQSNGYFFIIIVPFRNVLKRGPSLGFRNTPQTLWYPTIFWVLPQVLMTITEWLQGKDKSSPGLDTLCIQKHWRPGSSLRTACRGLTGNTLRTSRATFNHCESLFQCHHSTWELKVILGS